MNESRRFYTYVANRVQIIRSLSRPDQWRYVESSQSPADQATRGLRPTALANSLWINGPDFLRANGSTAPPSDISADLGSSDPEVRKVQVAKVDTNTRPKGYLESSRFTRFSTYKSLRRAIAKLIMKVRDFKRRKYTGVEEKSGTATSQPTVEILDQATTVIILGVQKSAFSDQLSKVDLKDLLQNPEDGITLRETQVKKKRMLRESQLHRLDPFIDKQGVLRVGGRLRRTEFEYAEKHPAILPKDNHTSQLIVRHFHQAVHHQGRQLTHGAVRQGGYWILGGHRLVSKELNSCVPCKKLRGKPVEQLMADLPTDRAEVTPPFTNVGFDVFGPWTITTRKTRGGSINSKRWALAFTCLTSRAVHIEIIETMNTDSFICGLRRFLAMRGPARVLRCDRGTNFIGGNSEMKQATRELDQQKLERFLTMQGCDWKFNPPHASHFGGAWERQIGTIRRVLDAMLAKLGSPQLTHELLVTLMGEVSAIVNARPIAAVPTDVDDPTPLSPSSLLTMKMRPLAPPPGEFTSSDLYARRWWRRAQYLADQFWLRWRREYLQNLQVRRKWTEPKRNLAEGDVVLMKEDGEHRNCWPMARVTEAHKSADGKVRKATVQLLRDGKKKQMQRPIKELVLLFPKNQDQA